jgi:hypothetical protein
MLIRKVISNLACGHIRRYALKMLRSPFRATNTSGLERTVTAHANAAAIARGSEIVIPMSAFCRTRLGGIRTASSFIAGPFWTDKRFGAAVINVMTFKISKTVKTAKKCPCPDCKIQSHLISKHGRERKIMEGTSEALGAIPCLLSLAAVHISQQKRPCYLVRYKGHNCRLRVM